MSPNTAIGTNVNSQLTAYEMGAKVTDQIIALQSSLATIANLFLIITGALWVAIGTDQLKLNKYASMVMLGLHLIGSLATLQIFAANIHAMRLRFDFLRNFGETYYRDIENIGKQSFTTTYGSAGSFRAQLARWGKGPATLWYLIPIAAFFGSAYFLIRIT